MIFAALTSDAESDFYQRVLPPADAPMMAMAGAVDNGERPMVMMAGATQNGCPNCDKTGVHYCEIPVKSNMAFLPRRSQSIMCCVNMENTSIGLRAPGGAHMFRRIDGVIYTASVSGFQVERTIIPSPNDINEYFKTNGAMYKPPIVFGNGARNYTETVLDDVGTAEIAITIIQGAAEAASQSFASNAEVLAALAEQAKNALARDIDLVQSDLLTGGPGQVSDNINFETAQKYFNLVTQWQLTTGKPWIIESQTQADSLTNVIKSWQSNLSKQKTNK